jgi:hAT family C-terminal dimerisation region
LATRGHAMVPSSCPVERSFSLQKRIHSKVQNRLAHETVRQLMFMYYNLKVLEPSGSVGDDDLDFLESAMAAAVTYDESGSPTRAATQTASCAWPRTTIATTTMASEKATTTAAEKSCRSEM